MNTETVEEPPEYTYYVDADFPSRVPMEKYQYLKEIEDKVLALQKDNLKVIVVCAGLLYGLGEFAF